MAGPYYVRSTDGDDSDDGSTWALAKATLAGAFVVASAGDTIYVSQSHAETQASTMSLTSPGTAAAPVRVLCGNDAAEPPTALATTATVTTNGNYGLYFYGGFTYVYGMSFIRAGVGANADMSFVSTAPCWWKLEACQLKLDTTGSSSLIGLGAGNSGIDDRLLEFVNTTVSFGHASQKLAPISFDLIWTDTANAIAGTVPTSLFVHQSGIGERIIVRGVDLSALDSGHNLVVASFNGRHVYTFDGCKLGSSVAVVSGASVGQGGCIVELINCDSADTNYRYRKHCYQGDIYHETACIRTGGASDGTTGIARKLVSSANSKFFSPLELGPLAVWNETTGSSVTATVEIITDNVTLTDAECWLEVEYLGTSGVPLSLFASDRAAGILTTPANQTASTETWSGTTYDGFGTPVKQKLSVAFTPQEKGPIKFRVMLAKASTTVYVCPKVDLT